jgi:hypothetical protein
MIVLKKTLKVTKGDQQLEEKIRYFFYITNEMQMGAKQLVQFYRDRADHDPLPDYQNRQTDLLPNRWL